VEYSNIKYDVAQNIATITFARPQALNALNAQTLDEVLDALDRVDADDEVRAVIFTGEGRAFCSGADISAGAGGFNSFGGKGVPRHADGSLDYSVEHARDGGGRLTLRLFNCLKPLIAAINGPAVGIGVTMTLPMDIRIASQNARFGFVFTRRGIVPEAASSWFLPRVVGISQALDWCLSARLFPAEEALAGGLVKAVVAPEELMAAARAAASQIAHEAAPVSVALARQMLWRGLGMSHPMEAHRIDSRGIVARTVSRDAAEGVAAFLEKRPASFPDRVSSDMPDYFPWWEEPTYS